MSTIAVTHLNNILEILNNIQEYKANKLKSKLKTNFGLQLFSKLYEIGTTHPDFVEIFESQQDLNSKIIQNLGLNSDFIKQFLINFSFIYLTEIYKHITTRTLRSGIEFLLTYWGESTYQNKKLKDLFDPLGRAIPLIDKKLAR